MKNTDLDIIGSMFRTTRALEKMLNRGVEKFGTTKAQIEVLILLRYATLENVTITDIANELHVSKASVSGVISKLLSQKLITRKVSSKDLRVQYIRLTKTGTILVDKVTPKYFGIASDALSSFHVNEKMVLLDQLSYVESYVEHVEREDE